MLTDIGLKKQTEENSDNKEDFYFLDYLKNIVVNQFEHKYIL